MDRQIIDFDPSYFGMTAFNWQIDPRGIGGGSGVTGAGQVVYGNQPRWTAALGLVAIQRENILPWRAILARVRGRVNVLRVKVGDPFRPTFAEIGLSSSDASLIARGIIPHSDSSRFSDGSGYTQSITAPIVADAAAGDTTLAFDGSWVADAFQGGQMFSVDDWLYQAVGVDGTGTGAVVTFEPPLRRPATAGVDEINLDATALVALQGDLEGALNIQPGLTSSPTLNIVEWVGPTR